MNGYYTANEIINESLVGIGDIDGDRYAEAAVFFLRGYRDFKLFNACEEKEAWLDVNMRTQTVDIPVDCIRVITVGTSISGEIFTFTNSSKMVKPSDQTQRSLISSRGENQMINRAPYSGYGAKGVNTQGYYNVDVRNRKIILNNASIVGIRNARQSQVLVRYVSTDIDTFENTIIPADCVNMLIAWVEYKLCQSSPERFNAQYRLEKKREFEQARSDYDLLNSPDIYELLDVIYSTSGQNIR